VRTDKVDTREKTNDNNKKMIVDDILCFSGTEKDRVYKKKQIYKNFTEEMRYGCSP